VSAIVRSSGASGAGRRGVPCFPRCTPHLVWWAAFIVAVAALVVCAVGCSSRESLHPALRLDDEDLERAIRKGKNLIATGQDPYQAYAHSMRDVNVRVSPHVIIRSAGCCWPRDTVAFHIAQEGDKSDAAVKRAVQRALKTVEREITFTAMLQIPKSRDEADLEFMLRTNTGIQYPPIVVETPIFIREVISPFDANAPVSAIYQYVAHFPVRGGPGVPPIGPRVSALSLEVIDGDCTGSARFDLRSP